MHLMPLLRVMPIAFRWDLWHQKTTPCPDKKGARIFLHVTSRNGHINPFSYLKLDGKFAVNSYLNIPPYLRHVATVPWEISSLCSKKRHALGVNEANCHVKLKHSKLLKKSCPVIKHFITHWQQDIHSSHITNFWSSLTQTLRKKKKKMPYTAKCRT